MQHDGFDPDRCVGLVDPIEAALFACDGRFLLCEVVVLIVHLVRPKGTLNDVAIVDLVPFSGSPAALEIFLGFVKYQLSVEWARAHPEDEIDRQAEIFYEVMYGPADNEIAA